MSTDNLTDLEIEKKIADIEGVYYIETKYDKNNFLALVSENDFTGTPPEMIGKYNPLTDDALLWRLAKKYRVSIMYWEEWQRNQCKSECDVLAHIEMGSGIWCAASVYFRDGDESLNKAILLCIIEAHNG